MCDLFWYDVLVLSESLWYMYIRVSPSRPSASWLMKSGISSVGISHAITNTFSRSALECVLVCVCVCVCVCVRERERERECVSE